MSRFVLYILLLSLIGFPLEAKYGRTNKYCGAQAEKIRHLAKELGFTKQDLEKKTVKAMQQWSSDLLIHLILQTERGINMKCPAFKGSSKAVMAYKKSYLKKLGIQDSDSMDELFRGLLAPTEDFITLKKRLSQISSKKLALKKVYGTVFEVRDVIVVGATSKNKLESFLTQICPPQQTCPFWDSRILYKVVVTPKSGLAAFIPETATLILSQELLTQSNPLHKIVLLHELSHIAIDYVLYFEQKDWVASFSHFSGWNHEKNKKGRDVKVIKSSKPRKDKLTKLSKGSPFSLLPDPTYLGVVINGKTFEGFVFSRSYHNSLDRKDPSEDLADHIAAFRFAPERFCFQGAPVAPKKYQWISEKVFGTKANLNCSQIKR